jgi:hypothetical protein
MIFRLLEGQVSVNPCALRGRQPCYPAGFEAGGGRARKPAKFTTPVKMFSTITALSPEVRVSFAAGPAPPALPAGHPRTVSGTGIPVTPHDLHRKATVMTLDVCVDQLDASLDAVD